MTEIPIWHVTGSKAIVVVGTTNIVDLLLVRFYYIKTGHKLHVDVIQMSMVCNALAAS